MPLAFVFSFSLHSLYDLSAMRAEIIFGGSCISGLKSDTHPQTRSKFAFEATGHFLINLNAVEFPFEFSSDETLELLFSACACDNVHFDICAVFDIYLNKLTIFFESFRFIF